MPSAERLIILPVADAGSPLLQATLEGLFTHSSDEAHLCVVAAAPCLHALAPMLARAWPDSGRLSLLDGDPAPWRALTAEVPGVAADADRLLLCPGVIVPPLWDLRLALAAAGQADAGLVNPLCERIKLLSAFSGPAPADADARVRRAAEGRLFQSPAAYEGCLWMAGAVRPLLGAVRDGVEAADALGHQGWLTLACDSVHVEDRGDRRAQACAIEALADSVLIDAVHPLTGLRYRLARRLDVAQADPLTRRPRQLHIAHSWGGGLNRWLRMYCEHAGDRDNLVLRSVGNWGRFGQRLALYRGAVMDEPLAYWDLAYPIRGLATRHLEYRAILREIIARFGIEAILVSSLIGHSLDALDTDLPTRIVAHDYFPFCPAVVTYFDGVCTACDRDRLQRCIRENPVNRFFGNISADEWLAVRPVFAAHVGRETVRVVAPSPSVATHWQRLMPQLPAARFSHIPHGLDYRPERLAAPAMDERLRVVVLGSLAPQKGRALLESILPRLTAFADITLLGCDEDGSRFGERAGVTIIPSYAHDALHTHMTSARPHLGLLLSVWPETFSYTLSELWLMGVPVLATNLGSFADRITPGRDGWLCEPTAEGVLTALGVIDADRAGLATAWAHLRGFEHRSMAAMVADYEALTPLPALSSARLHGGGAALPDPAQRRHQPIHVDAQAPFPVVLQAFGRYTQEKLAGSPRLRPWQRRVLGRVLRGMLALARGVARKPVV